MILHLTNEEHNALREIIRAGADGLTLTGRGVRLSTSVRLEQVGLAKIHSGHRLTVTATQAGKAFHWRSAA